MDSNKAILKWKNPLPEKEGTEKVTTHKWYKDTDIYYLYIDNIPKILVRW